MATSLDRKHIIVTGGCGDIGRAMTVELVERGARVTVFDIQEPPHALSPDVQAFLHGLERGAISFVRVDVSDRAAVQTALGQTAPFDVVIGNAGISHSAPFLEITAEQWQRHQDVNLNGNFYLGQEAAKIMIEQGTSGAIVFTGSWVQEVPWPEIAAYSASKAGLAMLMRTMALELAPHDIRVNVIAPGIVAAGMAKYQMDNEPQYARRIANVIPLGRLQTPNDVARAAAFLCSDDATYMTGATLLVDGGASLFQYNTEDAPE
jgi:NAD(P)-dependent dehydrogenase (short-subunit alcohol dehydrogenase family)